MVKVEPLLSNLTRAFEALETNQAVTLSSTEEKTMALFRREVKAPKEAISINQTTAAHLEEALSILKGEIKPKNASQEAQKIAKFVQDEIKLAQKDKPRRLRNEIQMIGLSITEGFLIRLNENREKQERAHVIKEAILGKDGLVETRENLSSEKPKNTKQIGQDAARYLEQGKTEVIINNRPVFSKEGSLALKENKVSAFKERIIAYFSLLSQFSLGKKSKKLEEDIAKLEGKDLNELTNKFSNFFQSHVEELLNSKDPKEIRFGKLLLATLSQGFTVGASGPLFMALKGLPFAKELGKPEIETTINLDEIRKTAEIERKTTFPRKDGSSGPYLVVRTKISIAEEKTETQYLYEIHFPDESFSKEAQELRKELFKAGLPRDSEDIKFINIMD
ncbi:hypothetical protein [Criblamydia sequanensis]|uniref:Uncharacterized protein n=1 Tax=Candidatus Criblamydia sequanensis CRIB-18 TaxID=1437425 RepID=A0A090E304_9BACT|nr:hypothetical protein [Criblamydia sequanensis]CDR35014.1 hypothetical protein CSEC_2208 [Criblamydia sequanensis CRIB-18]